MINKLLDYFKKNWFCFLLIFILIFVDQIIKILIKSSFSLGEEKVIIKNFISLEYVLNEGAGFGILQGKTTFLIIITIISFFIFGYLFKDVDLKKYKVYTISLILIISGTIGNFIDRLFNSGKVVDYISCKFISFPVFNFADSLLTIGVILLFIHFLFLEGKINNKEVEENIDETHIKEE